MENALDEDQVVVRINMHGGNVWGDVKSSSDPE